jgi:hypothetical protein
MTKDFLRPGLYVIFAVGVYRQAGILVPEKAMNSDSE